MAQPNGEPALAPGRGEESTQLKISITARGMRESFVGESCKTNNLGSREGGLEVRWRKTNVSFVEHADASTQMVHQRSARYPQD